MAPTYRKRYKKRRTRKEQLQMRILMILIAVILLGSILGIIHKVKQERAQQTVSDSSWDITCLLYTSCTGTARGNTGRRYQKTRGACTRNYKGCRDSGTFNTKRKDDCAGVFVFYRGIKKRISE